MRVEQIGDATLYLGDCLGILPTLGKVDAVVTDPPYGVAFKGKKVKHWDGGGYLSSDDSKESLLGAVVPRLKAAMSRATRSAVMCANRTLFDMPRPDDIGGIFHPAGSGISSWGFTCFHPILFYGRSPYMAAGKGSRPTVAQINDPGGHKTGDAQINHPCPKPLAYMEWVVGTSSLPQESVLDPFMGSGTTGVACAKLGRRFIGIEIEPRYFEIACRRIEEAYKQPRLFAEPAPKAVQEAMPL